MSNTKSTDWIGVYAPGRGGDVILAVDNIATISDHEPWVAWVGEDGTRQVGWASEAPEDVEWLMWMQSAYIGFKQTVPIGPKHYGNGVAVWASDANGEPAILVEVCLRTGEETVPHEWQHREADAPVEARALLSAFEEQPEGAGLNQKALTASVSDVDEATVQHAIDALIADGRLRSEGDFYYRTEATA